MTWTGVTTALKIAFQRLEASNPRSRVIWGLYLVGVLHWCLFMNLGTPSAEDFYAFDWQMIHQWLAVTESALVNQEIPYHVAYFQEELDSGQFIWGDRYFALPFLISSPQVLLLPFLDFLNWVTLQLVVVYSVGFYFLVKWINKLGLSPAAAAFVIILFSFNGFHSSRIGVAHVQNVSYFLVPWLLWIVNSFMESRGAGFKYNLLISLQLGFLLLVVLLQGSSQLMPNMVLVGFILVLHRIRQVPWYLIGGGIGFVLSSYIIWPILFFSPYGDATHRIVFTGYGGGSPQAIFLNVFHSLTRLSSAAVDGYWEKDAYISLLGLALIAAACVGLIIKRRSLPVIALLSPGMIVGMAIVVLLSLDSVYNKIWTSIQLIYPLPAVDRLPTRLIIYSLTYGILVSSLGFDEIFKAIRWSKVQAVLKWSSLIVLFLLLMQHSWRWSFAQSVSQWPKSPHYQQSLTFGEAIINHGGDDAYILIVRIAYMVSLVAIISAVAGYIYLSRKVRTPR